MKNQQGATIVEAALVLSLLFLLFLGILGFGVGLANYAAISHAAREGARFAVAPYTPTNALPTAATVAQKICTELNSGFALVSCSTYSTGNTAPPTVPTCVLSGGTIPPTNDIYVTQCSVAEPNNTTVAYTEVDIRKDVKLPMIPKLSLHTSVAMRNETN